MKYVFNEEFFEAILDRPSVLSEAKEEAKQVIRLENIKDYIAKYRGKRGRPNKTIQIIDAIEKMDDKELADNSAIKYAGLYLTQIDKGVSWTADDIVAAILVDIDLAKKYAKELGKGGDIPAKESGQRLAEDILAAQKEKHEAMQEFYLSMKNGTHKMIHQLPKDKFAAIESAMIRSFQLYTSLLNVFYKATKEPMFKHFLDDLNKIIIKQDGQMTYNFMNDFINGLYKISAGIAQVLKEDKPRGYEVKLAEIAELNKTLQIISGEHYALWPEAEDKITSLAELSNYFKEVKAYREDAEKVVNKYARRKKDLAPKKISPVDFWNEAKIKAMINRYIREKDLNTNKGTGAPHIKRIIDLAELILKENPSVAKYYKATISEDGVYELITQIAAKITRYVPFEIRFGIDED